MCLTSVRAWTGIAARRLCRITAILAAVACLTVVLVRCAPGYFSDERQLDYQHNAVASTETHHARDSAGSTAQQIFKTIVSLSHGDFGRSREFDIPVTELVAPRVKSSTILMCKSMLLGWAIAVTAACVGASRRILDVSSAGIASLALAIPCSAMVTLSLVFDVGGPVLVMTVLIAARDFKYLAKIVENTLFNSHVLQARAQGISDWNILRAHVLPSIAPDLGALGLLSILAALGVLVPVEVLFNLPGIGQLAWNAAMNRDLPVLVCSTLVIASVFTGAEVASNLSHLWRPHEA